LLEAAKTLFGGRLSLKCTDEFVVYSLTVTGLFVCAVVYSLLCYFGTREKHCWLAHLRSGHPPWPWGTESGFSFPSLQHCFFFPQYMYLNFVLTVNISPIFFFAQISQSLEIILIPACCFFLESSEAEISQYSHHMMPNM